MQVGKLSFWTEPGDTVQVVNTPLRNTSHSGDLAGASLPWIFLESVSRMLLGLSGSVYNQ